jgi:hypothetical protein
MDVSDPDALPAPATLSVPEAGRRLGLGKNASYEAARRGELPVLPLWPEAASSHCRF